MFYYLLFLSVFTQRHRACVCLYPIPWMLHIWYCDFFRSQQFYSEGAIWRHFRLLSFCFECINASDSPLFFLSAVCLVRFELCPRKILFKCVMSNCTQNSGKKNSSSRFFFSSSYLQKKNVFPFNCSIVSVLFFFLFFFRFVRFAIVAQIHKHTAWAISLYGRITNV